MTWKDLLRHLSNIPTNKLDGDVLISQQSQILYPSSVSKIDGNLAEDHDLVEDDPILVCSERSGTVLFALPIFDGDDVIDRTEAELSLTQLEEFVEAACRAVELKDDTQLRDFMVLHNMVDLRV